jgi:diadenylate cyclase
MAWIKNTRAWILVKGLAVLLIFSLFAVIFEMNTIIWLVEKTLGLGATAAIIIFQPELRKALEQLGKKKFIGSIGSIIPFDENKKNLKERFSAKTLMELTKAPFSLAKAKTGALIVIEREDTLKDYVDTGIYWDSMISSQLLIKNFEHNTPLHDGAVIIQGERVVAATCYLPLSDNMEISKELGTRHRAGLGISEVTDSLTIIVSEESGKVSIATEGRLLRGIDAETLRTQLTMLQNKTIDARRFKLWKGRRKNEKKTDT